MNDILLKLGFIPGLKKIVLDELAAYPEFHVQETIKEAVYVDFADTLQNLHALRSILHVYAVKRHATLNPHYISKHKSILGQIIEIVLAQNPHTFKTFRLSCAGSDSKDVEDIKRFISTTYKIAEAPEADMDIYIGKSGAIWEIGVRTTPRPLSMRAYKTEHIAGGMNPTIAYAMNTFCRLPEISSYLNIFSGSATLLIEAGLSNKNLILFGFDRNGKSNALAIQNIKKAGLIKTIQLKTADISDMPDLGTFDAVTADLPFGMQISKGENLNELYMRFVAYSEKSLNQGGTLVAYTTEHTLLESILGASSFAITHTLDLKVSTVTGAYIYPKIFVCRLKRKIR